MQTILHGRQDLKGYAMPLFKAKHRFSFFKVILYRPLTLKVTVPNTKPDGVRTQSVGPPGAQYFLRIVPYYSISW